MRINDSNLNGVAGTRDAAQTGAVGNSRNAERMSKSGAAGDQVQLSLGARLHELALNSADREAHIQRLAAQYAGGSYQVDARAVSAGIINDAFGQR
ncbi:MAG TPA: flagellar biosynthesis anti-sigma factor FlgM [Bryobacteraceae bacterium]|jgi:anti-sigma28 factor (negative regulator of flagellin synthesis)|nr:flagellar biosynthesis anti-sigma factor FlgM [Bryobacteraceae bacterium]